MAALDIFAPDEPYDETLIYLPDISEDLGRLEGPTNPPTTRKPSESPSLSPITPLPTTDNPTAAPSTRNPTTAPSPKPVPEETSTSTSTTVTTTTVAPETTSTSIPDDEAVTQATTTSTAPPVVHTYYSCPPPSPTTINTKDENGSDVMIEIPPKIDTVSIGYEFEVNLTDPEDTDINELLPKIQSRLGETLGDYMNSHTEYDEWDQSKGCSGYHVDDFRRIRRLNNARRRQLEASETRIIDISSDTDLTVDEDKLCTFSDFRSCSVVHGAMMATYVGTNEAGVASTVSREVKKEITNGDFADEDDEEPTYQLSYLGSLYEEEVQVQTIEGSAFDKIMSSVQEVLPEASEEGFKATPYGLGILIALGTTFLVLCYVIFVKSDSAEKVKEKIDERAEKRKAKKKALGEEDEEKQADDMDYCYDLESMSDEEEGEGEEGLEICSTFSFGSAKVGAASVFSKDSGRTKKMSNRSNEVTYDDAQKLDSLMEDEDAEDGSSTGDKAAISPSPSEDPSSSNENGTPR